MIKAIETVYNGYKFRSRLEARWAVFFDTLGIKYEYEKEGFDLDGTWYLPDFWLPELDTWIEIKGEEPTAKEMEKVRLLTAKTPNIGIIRVGTPDAMKNEGLAFIDGHRTGTQVFVQCTHCGKPGLFLTRPPVKVFIYRLRCECRFQLGFCEMNTDAPEILAAYTSARQARFEYGEKP